LLSLNIKLNIFKRNIDKANNILQWKAMKTIEDIVRDSWDYIMYLR